MTAVLLTLIIINVILMLMHVRSVHAQMRLRQNLRHLVHVVENNGGQ